MTAQQTWSRSILPVSLLLEGRRCLVVGGGSVAARKVEHLREAGALVTVISPELAEPLRALAAAGALTHLARVYASGDAAGYALVFAATSDRTVNKHVLHDAHQHGALCCCVDGNWPAGDFVSPATFRVEDLTVSVSSGGRSCRQSRLVKENLARHFETVKSADLIVMGTSHHYLPIDEREPYHLAGKRMEQVGAMLMQVWGVHEFLLLNTCNRVELIAVASREVDDNGLLRHLMNFDHAHPDKFYVQRGYEAFAHVALVAAGILSQSPGEHHIVAQIKEGLEQAVTAGWAAGMMQEWIASALHVSKEVRAATAALLNPFEIEDVCLRYLRATQADLAGKRALVIGAGIMGSGLVSQCLAAGMTCDWCYHVNAPELPREWGERVRLRTLNTMRTALAEADIVICAATGSGYVLHQGHAPFFEQEREVTVMDLAMPRNVDPAIEKLMPHLRLLDLDDLKHWGRNELSDLPRVLEVSRETVRAHRDMYEKIVRSF